MLGVCRVGWMSVLISASLALMIGVSSFKRFCKTFQKNMLFVIEITFFFPNQTQLHSSSSCATIAIGAIWSSWLLGLGKHTSARPSDAFLSRALRSEQEDRRKLHRVVFGSSHLREIFVGNLLSALSTRETCPEVGLRCTKKNEKVW